MTTIEFDTVSERCFAQYLDESKHRWVRHPSISGQSKMPDFAVFHSSGQVLCDVKERTPYRRERKEHELEIESLLTKGQHKSRARHFDPVRQVRHLINEGRRKFKDFDGHLCALIVFNNGHCDTRLDPLFIFGAMLGNPGFQLGLNVRTGVADPSTLQNVFLPRGGAMVRTYNPLTSSESLRNLSAVVALEPYRIPNPVFVRLREETLRKNEAQLRRSLSAEVVASLFFDPGLPASLRDAWGLTVCTNPFANIPFPGDLFNGPFDARWSMVGGELRQVFVGDQRLAHDPPHDSDEKM